MPELRTRGRQRAGVAGFTLVEMMISLVIIGIMAMIIAPSLGEMQQSHRQTSAAMDLVRLGRTTRAQANARGVSHMLRYNGGDTGLGRIAVHVGMNSSCLQTPWAQTYVANSTLAPIWPRDFFDMHDYNPGGLEVADPDQEDRVRVGDTDRPVIRLIANVGGTDRAGVLICYQPNGDIYFNEDGDSSDDAMAMRRQDLPVTFQIPRRYKGADQGRPRVVIFPPGGSARAL